MGERQRGQEAVASLTDSLDGGETVVQGARVEFPARRRCCAGGGAWYRWRREHGDEDGCLGRRSGRVDVVADDAVGSTARACDLAGERGRDEVRVTQNAQASHGAPVSNPEQRTRLLRHLYLEHQSPFAPSRRRVGGSSKARSSHPVCEGSESSTHMSHATGLFLLFHTPCCSILTGPSRCQAESSPKVVGGGAITLIS